MKTYITNCANSVFYSSQKRLNRSAINHGIDKVISYKYDKLIGSNFYKSNKKILEQPMGMGYWLWKPYIILETLNRINENNVLIYSDAGIEVIANLMPLFKLVKESLGVLVFNNCDYKNRTWTKRDCFVLMDSDNAEYWDGIHIEGAFQVYLKNEFSIRFVEEWLEYGKNENIITDLDNICGLDNLEGFNSHRRDQSILSNLAIKYKLEIYRCPTQYGNYYKVPEFRKFGEPIMRNHFIDSDGSYSDYPYLNSPYPTLLYHHRKKNKLDLFSRISDKIRAFK